MSPPKINVAGRISTMVFDKTGTLTADCLQIYGYRGVQDSKHENSFTGFGEFEESCLKY